MFGLGTNELLIIGFIVFDTLVMLVIISFVLARRNRNNAASGNADAQRLAELEREVATLKRRQEQASFGSGFSSVSSSPFSPSTSSDGEIEDLLRRGQKIQAIKLYRERTGVGLKEAKDAVEEIERRM